MWTPKSIRIPSTPTPNGPSFIELMDIFSFTEDGGSIRRTPGPDHPSIKLPPDLYPPTWASRDAVTDIIILAAKDQANTMLVRSVARKQLDKHGEQRVVLKCSQGKTYYPWGKWKDRSDEINNIDNKVNHFPNYVPTIRQDRMVNKAKAKRGIKKHEGKSMARRETTQKPIKGMECEFRFKLKLVPSLYWRVLRLPPVHGSHNHFHHQKNELIVRSFHLTPEEKTIGGLAMKFAGSGAASNIMKATTGHVLSKGVLAGVEHEQEGTTSTRKDSSASRLMDYLRKESGGRRKRWKALYHEVTESTLHTVYQLAKKKKENSKQKQQRETQQQQQEQVERDDIVDEQPLIENQELLDSLITIRLHLEMCSEGKDGGDEQKQPYELSTNVDKLQLGETLLSLSSKLRVGQKVLIAVAWCRVDERELFELFPEVLMFDVTFGTNTESRPLGVSASIDSNMNVFTSFRVFMPSQCQWVFDWIIGTALPSLLGKEALKRVQLFMSDGDAKIYNAFDKYQSTLMPYALHQLCMYHLVNKAMETMRQLVGKDRLDVINQQMTFKHSIFSWMGIGGVETDDEFNHSLSRLNSWLHAQQQSNVPELASNARVYDLFLTKTILHHKKRWFFPQRKHLLTLGQKTTSALEGVNQTIKYKSSKLVTPNMTMLQSLKTQDIQCQSRMDQYRKTTVNNFGSRPLWTISGSAVDLTKICESQIQQQYQQNMNYKCRVVSNLQINVVRCPLVLPFCYDCTEMVLCGKCSDNSPCVRFKRRRTITFAYNVETKRYVVRCSCPYYTTYGIPCRHVCKFLLVTKQYVNLRWWKEFAALYHRPGYEKSKAEFQTRMYDQTLTISCEEYTQIFERAHHDEREYGSINISLFNIPFEIHQNSADGLISSQLFQEDKFLTSFGQNDVVLGSQLSQEASNLPTPAQKWNINNILRTGNPYVDMNSQLQIICNQLDTNPSMLNRFEEAIRKVYCLFQGEIDNLLSTEQDRTGEFTNLYPSVDNHSVYLRKKSVCVPNRNKRKQQKHVSNDKTIAISTDSVV